MKSIIATTAIAASVMAFAQMPANAAMVGMSSLDQKAATADAIVEKTGRRGRRFRRGAGAAAVVTLGVLGIIAAAGEAEAEEREDRAERICRRWRRWCGEGDERACWKFENRC